MKNSPFKIGGCLIADPNCQICNGTGSNCGKYPIEGCSCDQAASCSHTFLEDFKGGVTETCTGCGFQRNRFPLLDLKEAEDIGFASLDTGENGTLILRLVNELRQARNS